MKAVLKSLAASLFATGLASFFLLMLTMGALARRARWAAPGEEYAVVDPSALVRHFGLPLAGAVFLLCFAVSLRRFQRTQER